MDNSNSQDNQPKYITHEDLNGALASQKKEFQKLMQQMQQQNEALVQTIQSNFGPKPEKEPLPSKQELSDDTAELKKAVKVLTDKLKQQEEEKKQLTKSTVLKDTLNKHGISSKVDLALKFLQDQVVYSDEGHLVMRMEEYPGVVQEFPLAEGIAKFAQSETGKFLADPRQDVRGSGSSNMQSPSFSAPAMTGNGSDIPFARNSQDLKAAIANQMAKSKLIR